jgi:probable rRNA maturation factor
VSDGGHTATIRISNRQDLPIDDPALTKIAQETLRAEGLDRVELSVSFVDEVEMAGLHERFMGEPGPTDVLSFPLDEQDRDENGIRLLGDVVIAPAVAARNQPPSSLAGSLADPATEIRLLLVHGILHLLGYDHEEDDERAEMWAAQERYSGVRVS